MKYYAKKIWLLIVLSLFLISIVGFFKTASNHGLTNSEFIFVDVPSFVFFISLMVFNVLYVRGPIIVLTDNTLKIKNLYKMGYIEIIRDALDGKLEKKFFDYRLYSKGERYSLPIFLLSKDDRNELLNKLGLDIP